ncbi:hypothetical protein E6P09_00505 [Haloferax mediterranei ATCC 33500]|uniref:Molybdopterin cofactor biosynthesis MoaD-related C-terminal domain-containing protein n=1 Tax=Haloferax mediterranei (strain ATCC 33500 / DSM 1411 / JCM 8866 / NBRC 14739 / NCIMB 2177 / R-4) TaxID=523841 RepID=I3R6R5_HALMT|nr:hypothetical protein [Haloferax mediterranei]AFK19925.1 hypothetical protein HFX_2237 [Haloferax mediterranei ATCC 33500]AHZ23304.1 hypothetical protein BM92_11930 [Haloferax mediterranei ATCC 33500]ELZ99470.1 hypothetical protein C439_12989 [Haloferax mediterranei ATCC 33500]MDX5987325.1 hypothetical protein [Haloferax mediterranei ATCC 33500]QCQ73840.1 hypothetical protein E6P09_00505 [Haloferax mediterranei ATCC 33500]
MARRERAFRGISTRLAIQYLEGLGGEAESETRVVGPDWTVDLDTEEVTITNSIQLTEVQLTFEGDDETLDDLIERFSRKAMRAGG